jgi:hypothetical protein
VVRPTLTPIQARVLGAALGVTGFALASVSGLSALGVAADSHIPAGAIWVVADGSDKGPPAGDAVRVFDCKNIDIRAFKLDDTKGDYTIYFDDQNGKDKKVTDGEWKFNKDKKDDPQVIATIDSSDLVSKLKDHGFHPQDNGWHLDVTFKDPSKTVEFILNDDCGEGHGGGQSSGGGGGVSSSPTPVHVSSPPPAAVKPVSAVAPKAAAAVPQTGADAPFLTGMVLMSAGGASLGVSRRLRRRNAG